MRRSTLVLGTIGLGFILACTGGLTDRTHGDEAAPAPEPDVAPPEADRPTPPGPPVGRAETVRWPLYTRAAAPEGASTTISDLLRDVDVLPDGSAVLVLAGETLWRWNYTDPPTEIPPPTDLAPMEMAISQFDGSVFVLGLADGTWRIERWRPKGAGFGSATLVYQSTDPISDPVTSLTAWDGAERLFFARESAGSRQVLGVTAQGGGAYEVTSPSGNLGPLTDRSVAAPGEYEQPPTVLQAASATPLSIDPGDGSLLWRDGAGAVHRRRYAEWNWGEDTDLGISASAVRASPNGWLLATWRGAGAVEVLDPDGKTLVSVQPPAGPFIGPPAWTPDGRALVGPTPGGVGVARVDHPLAPIRFLSHHRRDVDALAERGLVLREGAGDQLYRRYESLAYDADPPPVLATVDGLLEVLHAGFEAVFLRREREVSAPALRTFAETLRTSATGSGLDRVAEIAGVTLELLDGRADSAEAKLAVDEQAARSALHGEDVDFADFHPRGPYATDEVLGHYFRAFKYMNLLALSEAEQATLAADAALVEAARGWTDAQAAFLSGSRSQGLLADGWKKPAWLRQACLPEPDRPRPRRAFPLNWGLDSEIIDRGVAHDKLPAACGVPLRTLPSGLDLLAGLGSASAGRLLADDYGAHPTLARVHRDLAAEYGAPLDLPGVVPGWWRILQILGQDERVPEGIDAATWQARLAETALASWTSLRHTMVLVNEVSVAEMGDGGDDGFEQLSLEPTRGVVDPLPEAWEQVGGVLDMLAGLARGEGTVDTRVVEVLEESARTAQAFGEMARRQAAGEALADEEYGRIASFARDVEHPFLLLKTAASGDDAGLADPDPMMKIVDVHVWKDPVGPTHIWHAAVGPPREIVALVGDRGVLLPGVGAVYSYFEVDAGERLDDEQWRAMLQEAPPAPPRWSAARTAMAR